MIIFLLLLSLYLVPRLAMWYFEKEWAKNLQVDIRFQEEPLREGEEGYLQETVRNEKRLPLPLLHVKFETDRSCDFHQEDNVAVSDHTYKNDIFSLMGYQQIKRTMRFTARKRGIYRITHAEMVTSMLLFEQLFHRRDEVDTSIAVYPRLIPLEDFDTAVRQMVWASQKKARLLTDPFAFAGIREYSGTDPEKTINWNATAKTGGLMVNMYEKLSGQPMVILVNVEKALGSRMDEMLEDSLRVAVSWADALSREGMAVVIRTNLDQSLPPENESWEALNYRLAALDLNEKGRPFADWIQEDILPWMEERTCYGIVSHDTTSDMQEAAELVAERAGEAWMVRLGTWESERRPHGERLTVIERWVNHYE